MSGIIFAFLQCSATYFLSRSDLDGITSIFHLRNFSTVRIILIFHSKLFYSTAILLYFDKVSIRNFICAINLPHISNGNFNWFIFYSLSFWQKDFTMQNEKSIDLLDLMWKSHSICVTYHFFFLFFLIQSYSREVFHEFSINWAHIKSESIEPQSQYWGWVRLAIKIRYTIHKFNAIKNRIIKKKRKKIPMQIRLNGKGEKKEKKTSIVYVVVLFSHWLFQIREIFGLCALYVYG